MPPVRVVRAFRFGEAEAKTDKRFEEFGIDGDQNRRRMEDDSGGLFNIDIDLDDSEVPVKEEAKLPRDFQSEEDFQKQREEWNPKIEVGEVCFNGFLF